MPNDAKLGMVIGIGLVLLIAVIFFRQEPAEASAGSSTPAAAGSPGMLPPSVSHERNGQAPARSTSLNRLRP
jgi:hypothetical protein